MPIAAVAVAAVSTAGAVGAAGGLAALSLGGALALGATVVGAGLSLAGQVSGSKTLKKVGLGLSLAGGVGTFAATRGGDASGVGSTASKARNLDPTDISALRDSTTAGTKDVISNNVFNTADAIKNTSSGSIDAFNQSVSGNTGLANFRPDPSILERINNNITKYNGLLNVAGGAADAVIGNQQISAQKSIANKNRDFQREVSDRNYQGTSGSLPQRQVAFNPVSQGLLRGGAQ